MTDGIDPRRYPQKEPSQILRTDIYAKTSGCILETALQKIKPFCIAT